MPVMFTASLHRNVMGGTNVLIEVHGHRVSTRSYSTRSNARRAIRTGAVIRRACAIDHASVAYALLRSTNGA